MEMEVYNMNLVNNNIKIMIYTLLVLGIIGFAIYPSSYSKYYVNKGNYLRYNSSFVSLEAKENATMLIDEINSNEKKAVLNFTLSRNDKFFSENDTYTLILPDGCSSNYSNGLDNTNNISFLANDGRTSADVVVTCDVENDKNIKYDDNDDAFLDVLIKINEQVGSDEYSFRYIQYVSEDKPYAPLNKIDLSSSDSNNINEGISQTLSIKESFLNNVLNNDKYNEYMTEISSYVNSIDLSSSDFDILGVDEVIYNNDSNEYEFVINDNFIGYARTYYENVVNNNRNIMIFSTEDRESLNSIFEYYIRNYYINSDDEFYLIMNYMRANSDIASIILEGVKIEGISLSEIDTITIEDNFIDKVSEQIRDDYLTIYSNEYDYMKGTFISIINASTNLSQDIKDQIISSDDIISVITSRTYFDNSYFMVRDDTYCILIDVAYGDIYNEVSITNVVTNGIDILDVKINYTNDNRPDSESINSIAKFVAEQFNGIVEEGSLIEDNSDINSYSISFKVVKNSTDIIVDTTDKIPSETDKIPSEIVSLDDSSIIDEYVESNSNEFELDSDSTNESAVESEINFGSNSDKLSDGLGNSNIDIDSLNDDSVVID